jgi:hypothetical protein
MSQVTEQIVTRCPSCGEPLTGRYCAQCGEKVLDPHTLTVRHFIGETLVDELIHLDGKFWSTLRNLVFRPGLLSEQYCAGRRRPYIGPVKLLIATIITYALMTQGGLLVTLTIGWLNLSVAPTAVPREVGVAETVRRIDRFGVLTKQMVAKAQSTDLESDSARERFHATLNQFAQPLSFTNVVLLTFALYLLFHRRRGLLLDHAVFSMHLVSFVLLSSLALLPAVWLADRSDSAVLAIILAVTIWQFGYLTTAIRRFYFGGQGRLGGTRRTAFATAVLIYGLNSAFITGVQMVGGALALRRL